MKKTISNEKVEAIAEKLTERRITIWQIYAQYEPEIANAYFVQRKIELQNKLHGKA